MSKQSEAKEAVGFRKEAPCCKNCVDYRSELVHTRFAEGRSKTHEKKKRCHRGEFAVTSHSWCELHYWSLVPG